MYIANNTNSITSSISGSPVEISPSGLSRPQGKVTSSVYLDIDYGLGPRRVRIGLYGEEAPKTTENFRSLVTEGVPKPKSGMRYAGVPFNEDQGEGESECNVKHR